MYKGVKHVKATNDYKLVLDFDNDEKRIFDVKPYLTFGRFSELNDLDKFQKVHVKFDTVEWENGLDLDPELLYDKSTKIDQ